MLCSGPAKKGLALNRRTPILSLRYHLIGHLAMVLEVLQRVNPRWQGCLW